MYQKKQKLDTTQLYLERKFERKPNRPILCFSQYTTPRLLLCATVTFFLTVQAGAIQVETRKHTISTGSNQNIAMTLHD